MCLAAAHALRLVARDAAGLTTSASSSPASPATAPAPASAATAAFAGLASAGAPVSVASAAAAAAAGRCLGGLSGIAYQMPSPMKPCRAAHSTATAATSAAGWQPCEAGTRCGCDACGGGAGVTAS
ncbi:hypothetical protein COO60DRAFT_893062 [Scenedesmus sp. NREL 46B-D3]|nr:hypothetical protein COO60DRAFT_893062 [Scenedesmus sp. NREL 46B-D3]